MKLILIFLFSAIAALAQTPEWSRKYHTGSVTCLDFSGDGKMILSGSLDKSTILWNVSEVDSIKRFRFQAFVQSVDFNRTGDWFLVSTNDMSNNYTGSKFLENYIQDITDTIPRKKFKTPYYLGGNQGQLFGYVQRNFAKLTNNDKEVLVFISGAILSGPDSNPGGQIYTFLLDSLEKGVYKTNPLRFYTQPNSFALTSDTKLAHVAYDLSFTYKSGFQQYVTYYNIDNSIINLENNQVNSYRKFSTDKDTEFRKFAGGENLSATFSADSKKLLTANKAGSIHVRSVPEGIVLASLGSQTSLVTALAAAMQGRYYFSAHEDTTLRIWMPGVHNIFKRIPLQNLVTTIAISPDSVHFATAHTDGTVALWNIDSLALKAAIDSVFTPVITSITENKTLCKGENAEFQVAAQSNFGEELLYQWQKGGVDLAESDSINGVHSTKLVLKNIDASDLGAYSIKVTSATKPQSISASVSLAVKNIPVFKRPVTALYQQLDWSYKSIILFHAELMDSIGAEYQWFKNGVEIPGATKSQYYFERKDSALHAGEFTVRVTNQCGSTLSNPIIIEEAVNSISENPFKNTQLTAEPNPFKNSTTIRFSLPNSLKIKLAVTDILGREVAVLKDEVMEIGEQNVVFKNEDLPDGTYFITLSGDGLLQTIPVQIAR